jgi:hypothetical protein
LIASSENRGPAEAAAARKERGGASKTPGSDQINALKTALQEQRRALTLLNAEAEKQREAREALEIQLIEANAEIVASWDRRKEMSRVIADRDAEIKAQRQRRKEMAQIIDQHKALVAEQRAELQKRYEELAALQRHITQSTLQARAKQFVRRAKKLFG